MTATVAEPRVSVVELSGVTYAYEDGRPVLEDVRLELPAGCFVSLVGPNGGGKTTLLKLLLGLLTPSRGIVRVLGVAPREARRRVGYVPQHTRIDPHFPATVLEVVLLGRLGTGRHWGPFGRHDREAAMAALHEVRLDGFARRSFAR